MMIMSSLRQAFAWGAGACLALGVAASAAASPAQQGVVATVGGLDITVQEFQTAFNTVARQKLYHSNATPERMAELQQETLDGLILDRLLSAEAERRGIAPDTAAVERQLAVYEERYKGSAKWAEQRAATLPKLRAHLERDSIRKGLEASIREVKEPTEAELRAFYAANPQAFTEPSRDHVSVILLKVDPSSPVPVWDASREEAVRLYSQIKGGADFAELARLRSADGSAANGGDMGYLHKGMLSEEAQAVVDALAPGQVAEPVRVLQGYALLKLHGRSEPVVHGLDRVRERAVQLYKRDTGAKRWSEFTQKLLSDSDVKVLVTFARPQGASTK
jgi:hypothetical protein